MLRWFFWIGFLFILLTCMWTVLTVTKMRREHLFALTVLKTLGRRLELHDFLAEKQDDKENTDPPPTV